MNVPPALDRRFRDAAVADLDVAYDLVDSPVGELLVGVSDAGVCRISFGGESALDGLARTYGPRILRSSRPVERARRELDEYFEGHREHFDVGVDLSALPEFQRAVLEQLRRVPYGVVSTYGRLAADIGRPRSARAVGGALNRNPIAIVVPCHRIVGANGSLVGYAGGLERKRALLSLEGVSF
jgi:methylated-DNA-[protein]-cysteine S-methyltransferase